MSRKLACLCIVLGMPSIWLREEHAPACCNMPCAAFACWLCNGLECLCQCHGLISDCPCRLPPARIRGAAGPCQHCTTCADSTGIDAVVQGTAQPCSGPLGHCNCDRAAEILCRQAAAQPAASAHTGAPRRRWRCCSSAGLSESRAMILTICALQHWPPSLG